MINWFYCTFILNYNRSDSTIILVNMASESMHKDYKDATQINVPKILFTLLNNDKKRLYQTILDAAAHKLVINFRDFPDLHNLVYERESD